jgi:Zn finger protein HypA/HybF involved in hydrogenase expression
MPAAARRTPKSETSRALAAAAGLRCTACGARTAFRATAVVCPSCRASRLELAPWRPFSRSVR